MQRGRGQLKEQRRIRTREAGRRIRVVSALLSVLDAGEAVTPHGRRDPVADMDLLGAAVKSPLRPFEETLSLQDFGNWGRSTTGWFLAIHFHDLFDHDPIRPRSHSTTIPFDW